MHNTHSTKRTARGFRAVPYGYLFKIVIGQADLPTDLIENMHNVACGPKGNEAALDSSLSNILAYRVELVKIGVEEWAADTQSLSPAPTF